MNLRNETQRRLRRKLRDAAYVLILGGSMLLAAYSYALALRYKTIAASYAATCEDQAQIIRGMK